MAEQSIVHNRRDNARRMLSALITKQKDIKDGLEVKLKQYDKLKEESLARMTLLEKEGLHEEAEKESEVYADKSQKVAVTEEAIAQYDQNLLDLGVK